MYIHLGKHPHIYIDIWKHLQVSEYICLHLFEKREHWSDKQEIKDDYIVEAEGSGWKRQKWRQDFPNVPTFEMYYLFK